MILPLLAFAVLALAALAPLLLTLWRAQAPRGRRDSAIALHRAQLEELDRELEEGRLGAEEHAGATLEVQRRLLAAADQPDPPPPRANRSVLIATLLVVPIGGAALYVIDGRPDLPSAAVARAEAAADGTDADGLIATLRQRLTEMDPKSDLAAQGYLLLGNAEASRGRLAAAAEAWRRSLAVHFDPSLAAQTAEAEFQAQKSLSPDTKALFQRALADAPPDAPWRSLVQQRLGGG